MTGYCYVFAVELGHGRVAIGLKAHKMSFYYIIYFLLFYYFIIWPSLTIYFNLRPNLNPKP
jgi:hypothetical protein